MRIAGRVRGRDLGLLVVGRVVVRRAGGELGRAGVDGLEDRAQARRRAGPPRTASSDVRRSVAICASDRPCRLACAAPPGQRGGRAGRARATSLMSWIWSRNHGSMPVQLVDLLERRPPARSTCCTSTRRCSVGRVIVATQRVEGVARAGRRRAQWKTESFLSIERIALPSASVKLRPERHRLADRLHGRGQGVVGGRELLEREPRHLDDDVVERGLEARGRRAPVMSLGISSSV